jgi:hypothetical protein
MSEVSQEVIDAIRELSAEGIPASQTAQGLSVDIEVVKQYGKKAKSGAKRYQAYDESKTLREWENDSRCCVSWNTLKHRITSYGWNVERALSTPCREFVSVATKLAVRQAWLDGLKIQEIMQRFDVSNSMAYSLRGKQAL